MINANSLIPGKTHFIPLNKAIEMTELYRNEKEKILIPEMRYKQILPICETFNREAFDFLLGEEGCVGIRLYLSMDVELKVRIIAVGVNDKNEDLLPVEHKTAIVNRTHGIVEEGQRCPDDCPPDSSLNI